MFKLKGVVPPMITPFDGNGQLDLQGLETLVNFLKDKVDGLFICGSYGSGPLMSVEERKKVAETVKRITKNSVTVIVHAGTTNTRDTVELIKHAEMIGCDGCAAVAPYYFHHNEDSVIEFYSQMIKAVSSHFPVYLYYNPKFSGYSISLETIRKLKDMGVHGVKDASFDILTFATLMRELASENFDIVLGTEAMWLSARALGCEAYIPGLGNAFPEICHRMYEEGMSNDIEQCRKTQFQINELRDVMYLAKSTQLAIYTMLELRGVIKAYPRSPFIPAKEKEKREIEIALKEMGVL